MRELEAQIATANEMLWRSEERARQAEARALEAERLAGAAARRGDQCLSTANRPQPRD